MALIALGTYLLLLVVAATAAQLEDDIVLNRYPMILAHDADTGYLKPGGLITKKVYDWTKTQSSTFTSQLNCGARAFDIRPKVDGGNLITHHGDIKIGSPKLEDMFTEINDWVKDNPDELVIAYISHFDGDNATSMTSAVLARLGMGAVTSLSQLQGLTVGAAKKLAKGKALAVACGDCVSENYDPSIECYKPFYDPCWHDPDTSAWSAFWGYMDKTSAVAPSPSGQLAMLQAHWQEGVEDIATGVLTGKSLLLDESDCKQNARVLQELKNGRFPHVNLLELNNVCDGGDELRQWLLANRTR